MLVAVPQMGIPLTLVAGSIALSRIYNRAHHPSDILFSSLLAGFYGIPLGIAARRLAIKTSCLSRRHHTPNLHLYEAHACSIKTGDDLPLQTIHAARCADKKIAVVT